MWTAWPTLHLARCIDGVTHELVDVFGVEVVTRCDRKLMVEPPEAWKAAIVRGGLLADIVEGAFPTCIQCVGTRRSK